MRVLGFKNVFAGGDVINYDEEKGKYAAVTCGNLIARNICQTANGKPLIQRGENGSPGPVTKPIYIISLGSEKGIK
jgi:NADH dehydrogenase FAD-containing subunit